MTRLRSASGLAAPTFAAPTFAAPTFAAATLAAASLAALGLALLLPSLAAAASVEAHDSNLGAACAGAPAVLRGNANTVTFVGPCGALRITGDHNRVLVDLARAGTIDITGDYNQVIYTPGAPPPVTTLHGYFNDVRPGPALSSPTTLVLDGTFGLRDVHCDGLDVVIRESSVRYVLRGGCRSVTVQGRSNAIAAELLPSARLTIGGVGVVINYVLVGDGPPPSVFVTAPHARATHLVRSGESAILVPTVAALP